MASLEKPHVNEADVVVDEKDRKHVFVEGDISLEQRTAEARVRRKVDWRLIPILGILYSIAGLDRVNLSNARVAGMNQDLRFDVGNRYSIALLVFFITYFLFELPTTLALRPIGPKILLNGLVFSWGIVMLSMGMALWYMINLFISAFGNILAYAIIKLDGAHGALTVGFSFIGYIFTLPFPDQLLASGKRTTFTQQEIETILDRVERDRGDAEPDPLTWQKFTKLVVRWELWVYGFMFLCCSAPIYAFAYFIQIILTTLGYSTAVVFLLCAPPYLFSIIWTLLVAYIADKTRLRMPWMILNAAITLTGLLLTAYHSNNGVRYFGVFLGVSGCNGNLPTIIAFQSNNVRSNSRRSVASGVQMLFAAIGGIYASCTFMQQEYPTYRTGVWCAVATQFLLILLVALMWWYFRRQNRKADVQRVPIQDDPAFRYTF
ncbi:High-affinity nicotinic acid transporter [Colletotrichum sp. SAR 10_86]|nr:High-affinity nicotinic acid transporter [Colletotrichum sp. SAR 10_75]KAI8229938.1 High-affinity nicotinic acid transporter [Colletotrichum sp. SAR 10_86]